VGEITIEWRAIEPGIAARSSLDQGRIDLKRYWIGCITLLLAALAAGSVSAPAQSLRLAPAFAPGSQPGLLNPPGIPGIDSSIPGEAVVRFRNDVSSRQRDQLVGAFGCQVMRADPRSGYALVRARDNRAADLIAVLSRRPEVLHAELSYRLHILDQSFYDPYEWYLFDRGTVSARAPSNFGIQAASAWSYTKGAGVTVALVDSGVAYQNYNGFHQAPGLSLTHIAPGYNILDNSTHPNDDNGHGTHLAGVLAGNLVNGGGVMGVAPSVTVMPVKVMASDGSGRDLDIAEGIRWAADHGAQVINLSLGGPQAGSVLADAVNYAVSQDCVLVASAGNEKASQVDYPAAYSGCVAVGATAFDGVRAPYSNFGRNLEVVAPGGNLGEDLNGDGQPDGIVAQTFDPQQGYDSFGYVFAEGTSEAAPLVSGVAALVRSANPQLAALDVRLAIRNTAFHLGSTGRNIYYGYGLVDAAAAVQSALAQKSSSGG
jgi:serine protease